MKRINVGQIDEWVLNQIAHNHNQASMLFYLSRGTWNHYQISRSLQRLRKRRWILWDQQHQKWDLCI